MITATLNARQISILTGKLAFVFAMPDGMIATETGLTDAKQKSHAMPDLALKNARIVIFAQQAKNARICAQTATNAEILICRHSYATVLSNPSHVIPTPTIHATA